MVARNKIARLLEALGPYDAERIYLFGSWARGEADELSDVDLVVIKRTRASFFNRIKAVQKLLPLELGSVDALVYTPSEFDRMRERGNAFVETLLEEGRLIYAREEKNRGRKVVSPGAV